MISKGDICFESYDFGEAIGYYQKAMPKVKEQQHKQYLYGQIARCYAKLFNYVRAEEYFMLAIDSNEDAKPELYREYGRVLKANGKYEEAKQEFLKAKEYGQESAIAESDLQSIEWAIQNSAAVNHSFSVFQTNLDVSGQSLGYCYYGAGLIYCNARNKSLTTAKNKRPVFDLDYAINENSLEFTPRQQFFSKVNFEWNEMSPAITPDETHLYFAANAVKLKSGTKHQHSVSDRYGIVNYKIYVARKRDAEFSDISELTFNSNEYSTMHPCLLDGGRTMIFSSDRPGGFGGFDLYKATRLPDSTWSNPVNMGPVVNSAENEIFPWVNNHMLFFSSKGFNGYGGYDIFISTLNADLMPEGLKNMGQPVNSFRDDVAFITRDSIATGYFSSNRNTDNGADHVYFFKESQAGQLAVGMVEGHEYKKGLSVHISDSIGASPQTISPDKLVAFHAPEAEKQGKKKEHDKTKTTATPTAVTPPAPSVKPAVAVAAVAPAVIPDVPKETAKETPEVPASDKPSPAVVAAAVVPAVIPEPANNPETESKPAITGNKPAPVVAVVPAVIPATKRETQKNVQPGVNAADKKTTPVVATSGAVKSSGDQKPVPVTGQGKPTEPMILASVVRREFTPILFSFNDARITTMQKRMADTVIELYRKDPQQKIFVVAYTDSRGSDQYNLGLSQRRAASVRQYLLQHGIPAHSIVTEAKGETELLNECTDGVICSEEQHAVNRRVLISLGKK